MLQQLHYILDDSKNTYDIVTCILDSSNFVYFLKKIGEITRFFPMLPVQVHIDWMGVKQQSL